MTQLEKKQLFIHSWYWNQMFRVTSVAPLLGVPLNERIAGNDNTKTKIKQIHRQSTIFF